ncbi:segregation/condensation protein A [Pseudonocardia sp. MCCB 268]|nr:segregation/condensation protein A [Pseudonocardia cytotoxica]
MVLASLRTSIARTSAMPRHGPALFTVRLSNRGPVRPALQLIGKHEPTSPRWSLHKVTDDSIAHLTDLGDDADLDVTPEFPSSYNLLDPQGGSRLVPGAEVDDEEDLVARGARRFAWLLQYRAYKEAAAVRRAGERRDAALPAPGGAEDRYAGELLPEVLLGVDAGVRRELAATVFRSRRRRWASTTCTRLQVRSPEHAQLLRERLAAARVASCRADRDCVATMELRIAKVKQTTTNGIDSTRRWPSSSRSARGPDCHLDRRPR